MIKLENVVSVGVGSLASTSPSQLIQEVREEALDLPASRFLSVCGKRIRAGMLGESYRMAGGEGVPPSSVVEAVELLHAGSLIVDDIQDDSSTRRGEPTMHRQIGVPLSINVGNWMYFRALEMLSTADVAPSTRRRLLNGTIHCVRRCHEGQAIDLAARVDTLERKAIPRAAATISRLKTGALAGLSAWLGARCAPADKVTRRALRRFGTQVGVCLQMYNDLGELDGFVRGESRSDDLRNARVTWPWAWASQLLAPTDFDELRRQLSEGERSPVILRNVAAELLSIVASMGKNQIDHRLDRELRLLGEHVDSTAAIREILSKLKSVPARGMSDVHCNE